MGWALNVQDISINLLNHACPNLSGLIIIVIYGALSWVSGWFV